MPTYEFRCPEGHEFEKFYRSIGGAEAQAACPICGKLSERRMSAAGFAFKGSGFYLTDYGKNAHRENAPAASGDGASAASSESKGDAAAKGKSGSVEAKADAKSDAAKAPAAAAADKPEKKKEPVTKAADPKPASPKKASGGE